MGRRRYRVLWVRAAAKDLQDIVAYIALESPENARKVLRKLREKAATLDAFPERGRIVPEFARFGIRAFRELVARPYRLMYRVVGDHVFVFAVFDGRRDIEEIVLERLLREQ